jgi:5-methylcytosine-specific restriction endonuclease McrA
MCFLRLPDHEPMRYVAIAVRPIRDARRITAGVLSSLQTKAGTCVVCGLPFQYPYRGTNRTICSDKCRKDSARNYAHNHYQATIKDDPILYCVVCGKALPHHRTVVCSRRCKTRLNHQSFPSGSLNRRARQTLTMKYGDAWRDRYELIDAARVIARDGNVCQLCGKKTRIMASCQHDLYPSVDHIIPLACGGTHTYDNVQCAHRGCNSRKRDQRIGQLRLKQGLAAT